MTALSPLTSRLAARAPGLAAAARRASWKARNLPRTIRFAPETDLVDARLLDELVRRGIAVRPFEAVFRDRGALERLVEVAAQPESMSASPTKEFLRKLMPETVAADSPYVALALEPQVVALANAYLEMRSYLRALDVWLNLPTAEPPKLSQLWHRDYDDVVNLKFFVYLTDVGERSGPFTFAPGTHPRGPRRLALTERLDDDAMAAYVPRDEWVVATGPVGTVVIADTCGFHKGGKPDEGSRVLWTAQFTSAAADADRNFELEAAPPREALSDAQRAALSL